MPTARELLEQADALMRRNRARAIEEQPAVEIPLLTETVDAAAPATPPARAFDAMPDGTQRAAPVAIDDVPLLTDAVEEIEAPTIVDEPDAQGPPSEWLEVDRGETSITGPLPDSVAVVSPSDVQSSDEPPREADAIELTPPVERDDVAANDFDALPLDEIEAPVAPPADESQEQTPQIVALASMSDEAVEDARVSAAADEDLRWDALAEEIRMQVLQRIDIFTDTGLREQLTARLQPIVDRASADLVATINQHVGQLIRSYVAEAIEREIEKWKQGGA